MTVDQVSKVVILCGGRGTRLRERTRAVPKALVEIGGLPIIWHVIQLFASQGLRNFVLCTGYRGALIERAVAAHSWPAGLKIDCVDTGLDTPTGGRIARIRDQLEQGLFLVTYADGLADIDLAALVRQHTAHSGIATMTVVQPREQFGVVTFAADDRSRVQEFREKPRSHQWVNGGFFCFQPAVLEHCSESSVLERDVLGSLAPAGELYVYRHEGFWECMDTYKDALTLNDLWNGPSRAPWCVGCG